MDALKHERALLRVLLFERPIFSAILALAMTAGCVIALRGWNFTALLLIAGPAFAWLGASAFRLEGSCESAGALGIPGHLPAARRVQYILAGLFAILPSIYLLVLGFDRRVVLMICLAGAVAVSLQRPWTMITLVIAWWAIRYFDFEFWEFAGTAPGILLVAACSIAGFLLWFRVPAWAHARGVWATVALADARHEMLADDLPPAPSPQLDSLLPSGERMGPETFWGALGHLPDRGFRLTAAFATTWLAVFVAMHFYKHGQSDVGAYLASSLLAGTLAGLRFFKLQAVWSTTAGEQSLLMLTPRWPPRGALKGLVYRSLWEPLPAAIVAWLAVSIAGQTLGWFSLRIVAQGAVGVIAAMVALFGFLVLFLAQSRLRIRVYAAGFTRRSRSSRIHATATCSSSSSRPDESARCAAAPS